MMWRFIVTEGITILNALAGDRMRNLVHAIYQFCNKAILFTTPWWTFLAHTRNAWLITQPGYEEEIREIIEKNVKNFENSDEKVFIDIWAHVGRYVIELAKNYGYYSVWFEPSPETFRMLRVNTILSGVENSVQLFNMWLSDHDWKVEFEYFDSHDGWSRVPQYADAYSHLAQRISIPVVEFDKLDHGIDPNKVALILIDVEWYELYVLRGMEKFLSRLSAKMDLVVEIFENNPARDETIDFLKSLGFSGVQIEKDNWYFSKS